VRECSGTFRVCGLILLERDAILEELKIYGRNPDNADPIFTKEAGILHFYAYHSS
jgi:hypothetical protein